MNYQTLSKREESIAEKEYAAYTVYKNNIKWIIITLVSHDFVVAGVLPYGKFKIDTQASFSYTRVRDE